MTWDITKSNRRSKTYLDTSDINEAEREFGSMANVDLNEVLKGTIGWYRRKGRVGVE
jgi:hypothetical protein